MVRVEVNMGFGRNPHVAKAQAAEQKAQAARDDTARELAWRDAARQWDRAADRETDDKRKQEYSTRAEAARTSADNLNEPDEAPVARPRTLDKTSN
jgi:hypothetical protein